MSRRPTLVLLLILSVAWCEVITYPSSSYDYDYPSTTLLSESSHEDEAFTVNLPFPIRFQGASYSQLSVSSNSYVTFGGSSRAYSNIEAVAYPKILVDATDNYALGLSVTATSENVTVHYLGRRWNAT